MIIYVSSTAIVITENVKNALPPAESSQATKQKCSHTHLYNSVRVESQTVRLLVEICSPSLPFPETEERIIGRDDGAELGE